MIKYPSDNVSFGLVWVNRYTGNDVGAEKASRIVADPEYGDKMPMSKMTISNAKRQSDLYN
ncbi:hypothetical protein [Photobacterium sp. DNB22_13_2]